MRLHSLRFRLRALAAAFVCTIVAACATPEAPVSVCQPVEGLDPTCMIDRPLLKEAIASYKTHYNKMKVGQSVSYTEGGVAIPFPGHRAVRLEFGPDARLVRMTFERGVPGPPSGPSGKP